MRDDPAGRIATVLTGRGLAAPARLLADAHRPLAPLLSDLGAALGPLAGAVAGSHVEDLRELLEDESGLERLVEHLDDPGRRADDRSG